MEEDRRGVAVDDEPRPTLAAGPFVQPVRAGGPDRRHADEQVAEDRRRRDRRWHSDPLLAGLTSDVLHRFGGDLYRLRSRQGWSQAQLANVAGVNRETVEEVERGQRDVRISSAVRVMVPFGLIPYLCFQATAGYIPPNSNTATNP